MTETFYEENELRQCRKYLQPGAVVLDIGSNIGNHTIFFTKCCGGKKVYCFEPMKQTFEILKRNIQENGLMKRCVLFRNAVGDQCSLMDAKLFDENNLGITELEYNPEGSLECVTIDSLSIKEKVDYIKIDVEGFEDKVILGAKELLKKSHPVIQIEIADCRFKQVNKLLEQTSYKLVKTLGPGNYIYQ